MKCRIFILLLLLIHFPAWTKSIPEYSDYAVTAGSGLNLRTSPSTSSRVITCIPSGSRLSVLEKKTGIVTISSVPGHWFRVRWRNHTGWVFSGYLKEYVRTVRGNALLVYLKKRYIGTAFLLRRSFPDSLKEQGGGYVKGKLGYLKFALNDRAVFFLSEETGRHGPNGKYAIFTCRDILVSPKGQIMHTSGFGELFLNGKRNEDPGVLVLTGPVTGSRAPVYRAWRIDDRTKTFREIPLAGRNAYLLITMP